MLLTIVTSQIQARSIIINAGYKFVTSLIQTVYVNNAANSCNFTNSNCL